MIEVENRHPWGRNNRNRGKKCGRGRRAARRVGRPNQRRPARHRLDYVNGYQPDLGLVWQDSTQEEDARRRTRELVLANELKTTDCRVGCGHSSFTLIALAWQPMRGRNTRTAKRDHRIAQYCNRRARSVAFHRVVRRLSPPGTGKNILESGSAPSMQVQDSLRGAGFLFQARFRREGGRLQAGYRRIAKNLLGGDEHLGWIFVISSKKGR